jgi:hypothetical protein
MMGSDKDSTVMNIVIQCAPDWEFLIYKKKKKYKNQRHEHKWDKKLYIIKLQDRH